MNGEFVLFAGSANRSLAGAVGRHLGVSLGDRTVERFPDGEVSVRLETSVRRKEVFILQPSSNDLRLDRSNQPIEPLLEGDWE